jgi:predicted PhzF superfamily epimerase YddE/YHI9
MAELNVLRVFVGDDGEGGNPLGVFLPGHGLPEERFQAIAADLGFSETVFVSDALRGELRIFTPAAELPLAGHPLVGTSWLLREEATPADVLRPPAGEVPTWREGETTWIRADPTWAPAMEREQLDAPEAVDAHRGAARADQVLEVWAWEDEDAGLVRARVFPRALGIDEDEATGAAALLLCAELGRPITIRQGAGSRIDARPAEGGLVEVGGRVERLETRDHS